jgi:periplasmic copper chaperone A
MQRPDSRRNRRRDSGRRSRLALGAVAAVGLAATSACASGQIAETANESPAVAGTQGSVGQVTLRDVGVIAPPRGSYPAGGAANLAFTAVNSAGTADRILAIESPAAAAISLPGGGIALPSEVAVPVGTKGGKTVALTGLRSQLRSGQTIQITFRMQRAGNTTFAVSVNAPIRAVSQPPADPPPEIQQ